MPLRQGQEIQKMLFGLTANLFAIASVTDNTEIP
jgi:hypothetical protein